MRITSHGILAKPGCRIQCEAASDTVITTVSISRTLLGQLLSYPLGPTAAFFSVTHSMLLYHLIAFQEHKSYKKSDFGHFVLFVPSAKKQARPYSIWNQVTVEIWNNFISRKINLYQEQLKEYSWGAEVSSWLLEASLASS